jgi:hypothetical protein
VNSRCVSTTASPPPQRWDHVEPHGGDYNKFMLGKLQSLCLHHHVGAKHVEELRGYSTQVGVDELPIDPRHPFFQGEVRRRP